MKLSHTSEMAIHGLWELALSGDERLLVSEIAKRQDVSESYLAKIFHKLGQAGIVISRRGKVGGFVLGKPADEITIGEIVRLFDIDYAAGDSRRQNKTSNLRSLSLLSVMENVETRVFDILDKTSLADLRRDCPDIESPKLSRRKYTKKEGSA